MSRGRVCPEIHLRFAGQVIPLALGQSAMGTWGQQHCCAWAAGSTDHSTAGFGDGLINAHCGDEQINTHRAACPCHCTHFCTAACLRTDGLCPASAPAHAPSCNPSRDCTPMTDFCHKCLKKLFSPDSRTVMCASLFYLFFSPLSIYSFHVCERVGGFSLNAILHIADCPLRPDSLFYSSFS